MYRHLLPKVPEAPVGDLDRVSVEQGMEDVTWRNSCVEDLEELGPDTALLATRESHGGLNHQICLFRLRVFLSLFL